MTANTATSEGPPLVPLRQRTGDGSVYTRPTNVVAALAKLCSLPGNELVERARITDPSHPDYVPSECVLYFVRHPAGRDKHAHRELFTILRQRVLAAVPVIPRRHSGSRKEAEGVADLDIREAVLHKFQVLLCNDRKAYEEGLDFYECRFNAALASLRSTVRRDVRREADRFEPLESESEPGVPSATVEDALQRLHAPANPDEFDFLSRSKLLCAISLLPAKEQRVIELILQGYQIGSSVGGERTIASILGCDEKTVRNRRDRAYAKLRDAMADNGENA